MRFAEANEIPFQMPTLISLWRRKADTMDKKRGSGKTSPGVSGRKKIEDSGMIFDMPSCGGCRTCELACSFHHTGEFIPSVSSLRVLDREDGPGYRVLLVTENCGESIACDGCKNLDVPLCIEYCKEMDDLGKILLRFQSLRDPVNRVVSKDKERR